VDAAATGAEGVTVITGAYTAEQLLCVADAVVTDYSSLAFDACLLKIPLFFWVYDIGIYTENPGLNIDPTAEYGRYTAADAGIVAGMIAGAEDGYDPAYQEAFISRYIEVYNGDCTEQLADCIADAADARPATQ
jgi:CDP-ribitol ribitolphosphotransferase